MATAPVKPLIGGASAPPEGHELNLVSFDKPGYPQLLLQELGDLPLYLDNDGFFSVNGLLGFTVFSPRTELAPVTC